MAKSLQKTLSKAVNDGVSVRGLNVETFEPLPRHIVVEPLPPETTFGGTLVIPETHRKQQQAGYVRAIAPADKEGPFQIGDVVLYANNAGTDIRFGDVDMKVMQWIDSEYSDILGRWPFKVVDNAG